MKIQNLAIIFIIIMIPIILIVSYYITQNAKTLEIQEAYNSKIITAGKNAIKSFEINTVDWKSTEGNSRRNAENMVNTFTRSLANELGLSGTAKEYMINYIPAISVNMYDGYYIYAPAYVPVTITNPDGVQLFYNRQEQKITTDSTAGEVMYKAKTGGVSGKSYEYVTSEGTTIIKQADTFVTNELAAEKTYEHMLSNKIAYTSRYKKGSLDAVVNFTLDNRIYVYANDGTTSISKDGYLAYFDYTTTNLPRMTIKNDPKKEEDITFVNPIDNTVYSTELSSGAKNKVPIEPETLTEQIVYKDSGDADYRLGTFKYLYDIEHNKLFYDEYVNNFFTLSSDNIRQYLQNTDDITAKSEECKFKSVSVLLGTDTYTTEYKKIYQALNGRDKGKWYISIKEDSEAAKLAGVEEIDTQITKLEDMGVERTIQYAAIYKDYSAISYYVEAYAFTNWVRANLGTGTLVQQEMKYNTEDKKYEMTYVNISGAEIFDINKNNDPEDSTSSFTVHKREVMQKSIEENLNLSIANYNSGGKYNFQLPILSASDWDKMFENISILTFVQGMPIGLKYYNNYVIATSKVNREYVDPNEIFMSGADQKYHLPKCEKTLNTRYTGYRSAEYVVKNFKDGDNNITYYEHDEQGNNNSELGCYYCVVNRDNFKSLKNTPGDVETEEKIYYQVKGYDEALARERYYQKEKIKTRLGVTITYHPGLTVEYEISSINDIPEPQNVDRGTTAIIQGNNPIPTVTTNDRFIKYIFIGWAETEGTSNIKYYPGEESDILEEDIDLYAVWRISLSNLNWKRDYLFVNEDDAFINGVFNNTSRGNVTDGSISYIYIDETENGSRVQMVGNENKMGKGATWATFSSEHLEIKEFTFKYYLNAGHSFNGGGFLFNIEETGLDEHSGTLEGYMLSINFNHEMLEAAKGQTGAIFKFRYDKGKNEQHFEYLEPIYTFDLANYSTERGSDGSGYITIQVGEGGYTLKGNELGEDLFVPVENINPDSFGFFSDHFGTEHGHTCTNIGYFRLEDIRITVVRDK